MCLKTFPEIYAEAAELYKCASYEKCEDLLLPCLQFPDVPLEILLIGGINMAAIGNIEKLNAYIGKIISREISSPLDFYNLAYICEAAGRTGDAIANYQKTLDLKPDNPAALNNLANIYKSTGQISKALDIAEGGIKLKLSSYELQINTGNILAAMGKIPESLPYYKKAMELKPYEAAPVSNFLLALNYSENYSRESIYRKHIALAGALEKLNTKTFSFNLQDYSSDKIRIGYVSGDFRRHSIAFFFEPLIHFHDKNSFEIFCYSDVKRPDNVTERIRKDAGVWRATGNLSDEKIADLIYQDKINILVDLAGHTGPRLKTFIMKPAPIQVTYLGYPNTTGLSTMDYRITDEVSDPLDADRLYTEKLVRFKKSFLSYAPPDNAPDISDLPFLKNRYFTFGSFNNFPKMTPAVLKTWALILKKVPGSRIFLKNLNFIDENIRNYVFSFFRAENIPDDRVSLLAFEGSMEKHLELYNQIDLALDTFPYNGTTTTFEALWMGVPTLTLAGDRHAARVGLSILSGLEIKTLVAETLDEYIGKAVFYAENPSLAATLRSALRNMLASSHFCKPQEFVTELETFYSNAWERLNISSGNRHE